MLQFYFLANLKKTVLLRFDLIISNMKLQPNLKKIIHHQPFTTKYLRAIGYCQDFPCFYKIREVFTSNLASVSIAGPPPGAPG